MTVGRRSSVAGIVFVLCLVLGSVLAPLAVATGPAPVVAGAETGDTAAVTATERSNETIDIADELPRSGRSVEVVVRLEEAPVAASDDAVAEQLEDHAEETQEPLLEYAAGTPAITVVEEFWLTNAVLLEVDLETVDLDTFERFAAVEAVHRNFEVSVPEPALESNGTAADSETDGTAASTAATPRTDASTTAGIAQLKVPSIWSEYETRGEGVRIAVLDTGIDVDHPDLELHTDDPSDPTYPGGWAEFDSGGERVPGSTPYDTGIHGTHVSGTVAGGNATGTAIGVAPDATLLHGLVLDESTGTFAQIVAGMEWALAEDADIINMSLGSTGRYAQLIDPVRNAQESGTIVVGAIGNEGAETSGSPGNVYETFSVGAVHGNGTVASFSGGERLNRTDWEMAPSAWPDGYVTPDVVAPGVSVPSAVPGGTYARMPGTSMATPHVSGTTALLLAIDGNATPAELSSALAETAWKPDGTSPEQDTRYGHGIVDAEAAAAELVDRSGTGTGTETDPAGSSSGSESQSDPDPGSTTEIADTSNGTTASSISWGTHIAAGVLAGIGGALVAILAYGYRHR